MEAIQASKRRQAIHQVAAVPFRWPRKRPEFCLVTSSAGRWIFPKGVVTASSSLIQTALTEAWEEAGLRGAIIPEPLGWYDILKDGRDLTVLALLMKVESADSSWKEKSWRKRRWVTANDAKALLGDPDLKQILSRARQLLNVNA